MIRVIYRRLFLGGINKPRNCNIEETKVTRVRVNASYSVRGGLGALEQAFRSLDVRQISRAVQEITSAWYIHRAEGFLNPERYRAVRPANG